MFQFTISNSIWTFQSLNVKMILFTTYVVHILVKTKTCIEKLGQGIQCIRRAGSIYLKFSRHEKNIQRLVNCWFMNLCKKTLCLDNWCRWKMVQNMKKHEFLATSFNHLKTIDYNYNHATTVRWEDVSKRNWYMPRNIYNTFPTLKRSDYIFLSFQESRYENH